MRANFTFPRTLEMQFWKSWGLKDSDIEGLQSVPFSSEIHVCMQTGIDDSQLVLLLTCGEVTLGSTLDRGSWGYKTYFLILASDLCVIPKEKTFLLGSKLSRLFAKVFLARPRSPRNILRVEIQMRFVSEGEFSPSMQMPSAKTFLSWAAIEIAPPHVG